MATALTLVVASSLELPLVSETTLDFKLSAILAFALDAKLFAVVIQVVVRPTAHDPAGIDGSTAGEIAADVDLGPGVAMVVVVLSRGGNSEAPGQKGGCDQELFLHLSFFLLG